MPKSTESVREFGQPVVSLSDPASDGALCTPSDSDSFANPTRGLWIGSGGDVSVTMYSGNKTVFQNVADSTILPIMVMQVLDTGTTADSITLMF